MRSCHEASQSAIHDTRAEGSKVGIMSHMSSEVQLPGGLCGYHEKGRKMSGECHVTLPCDGQSYVIGMIVRALLASGSDRP